MSEKQVFDQKYKKIAYAIYVSFAFGFTFITFGVFDIYMTNMADFPFVLKDIILPTLCVTFIVICLLSLCLVFLMKRIYNEAITVLTGLLICGYAQFMFLNLNLGQLNGNAIDWSKYGLHWLFNLMAWILIIGALFVLKKFAFDLWKKSMLFLPFLIIGMQLTGLVSSLLTTEVMIEEKNQLYLSTKGIFEMSSKENIIVLLLDRLDGDYISEVIEDDPNYFDFLDGFTYYDNNISQYARTFPSVTSMFTGVQTDYSKPATQYFKYAWGQQNFMELLKRNGYTTKMYSYKNYVYSDISQVQTKIDNISKGSIHYSSSSIMKQLLKLSGYRYMPHVLKRFFWIPSQEFNSLKIKEAESELPYVCDDRLFYDNLLEGGLTVQDKRKNFEFIHLDGIHEPLRWDENFERIPVWEGSTLKQTKGSFKIVETFLSKLKELNLYDDATIIILGDHGYSHDNSKMKESMTTALFIKESGQTNTPLAVSNKPLSHDNFRASILKYAGLNYEHFGVPYSDIEEEDKVIRDFYYRVNGATGRYAVDGILEKFKIRGDANDFSNWEKVGESKVKYPHG